MEEGYYEAWTVVEGALDSEGIFPTEKDALAFLERERRHSSQKGLAMEGYLLYHYHREDHDECACAQYLTDHHPIVAYSDGDDVGGA